MNREQPEVTKQVYPLTVGKLFLSIYMKNLLSRDFFFFKENRNKGIIIMLENGHNS
jgi:hypothetical protein